LSRLAVLAGCAGAIVALALPAAAGAGKPAPGAVYKGQYEWGGGMSDPFRIKVFEGGGKMNFSLKCAGVVRDRTVIRKKGKFAIRFGAEVGTGQLDVRGRGRFTTDNDVVGEIETIETSGATCEAPGQFGGLVE